MQKRLTFFRAVCYPQWVLAYYLYHLKLQVGFRRKVLGEKLNEYQWMAVHYNAFQEDGRFTTNLSYIVKYYPETNKQKETHNLIYIYCGSVSPIALIFVLFLW